MDEFICFCPAHPDAIIPQRQNPEDAGYDLSSIETININPQSWSLISTGLKIILPKKTYGRIAPRSGLSCKGTNVGAGVIDKGYQGIIKVLMFNHSHESFTVKKGDRIAQLIIEVIKTPPVKVITESELMMTQRGENGFGSTGV